MSTEATPLEPETAASPLRVDAQRNLARILAAVDRLEEARKRLDPKRWSLLYAPSWRILTQDILPDFPANMHEPARKLATGMPLLPELE